MLNEILGVMRDSALWDERYATSRIYRRNAKKAHKDRETAIKAVRRIADALMPDALTEQLNELERRNRLYFHLYSGRQKRGRRREYLHAELMEIGRRRNMTPTKLANYLFSQRYRIDPNMKSSLYTDTGDDKQTIQLLAERLRKAETANRKKLATNRA
jgi:hypothetical protein